MPATTATGNEIGGGITYDDVTNRLSMDFAYGSAFGFTDLQGDMTVLHIHGPSPVNFPAGNTGAGVQFNLAGFHTPSGPRSGRITGVQVLSAVQESMLINNELYVNIHSGFATGGEIRGQFIIVPEPSTMLLALGGMACLLRRRRS